VVTCKQWHGIKAATVSRRKVDETNSGTFPEVTRTFTSLSCMHCEQPACVAGCPTGALSKREEDGIVVVDKETCINCKTCSTACPFDVPQYDEKMDKCDACLSLGRTGGEEPRCVITCPCKALHFGEMSELQTLAAKKNGKRMEGLTSPAVFLS
jgi:Fe-S-cluster-containing dehydrogenase component